MVRKLLLFACLNMMGVAEKKGKGCKKTVCLAPSDLGQVQV